MRQVIVVEDDAHNAILFRKLIEKRLGCTVTLTGCSPPLEIRSRRRRLPPLVLSTETLSSPPFTTNSSEPSRVTPPWEASEAPVPRPPVATVPWARKVPFAVRSKTAIALPLALLVA